MADQRLGCILEHLLVFGYADTFGLLPPQRCEPDRVGWELLGHKARQQPHCRRLFILLIFMADRRLERLFKHLLDLGNSNPVGLLSS